MRILVVEDERKIARFVQKGLKEFGFAVDVIGRGDEALEMILDNRFDASSWTSCFPAAMA